MTESYQNLSQGNFDPNAIAQMTSTVIQSVVVLDISPSISSFVGAMNEASREVFMKELKTCHRRNEIVLQCITFCDKVNIVSGFRPIVDLDDDYLDVKPQGRGTALYSAVLTAFKSTASYREDLENQGIEVRTNIFIITDGEDNYSDIKEVQELKGLVDTLRSNESWANTFSITMYGVGDPSTFKKSCLEMGLNPDKCLTTLGSDPKEIRNMMGIVSKSSSSSVTSTGPSF